MVNRIFRKLFPPHSIILLYEEYDPTPLLKKVNSRRDRYIIKKSMNVEEGWEKVTEEIMNYDAVFLCDIHSPLRNRYVKFCIQKASVPISLRRYLILLSGVQRIYIFLTRLSCFRAIRGSVLRKNLSETDGYHHRITGADHHLSDHAHHRSGDQAVRRRSGLFPSGQMHDHGKVFSIHKFRSMIENAEKEGEVIPTTEDDQRITPVGKFIRKTRLDELPQFIDILKGDMSVVGPRPERVEHVRQYTAEIPEFEYRLKVKGGLTGYAQIYGKYNTKHAI